MIRPALFLAALLVAPANAEQLLVELRHSGTWQGATSIQPAYLAFQAYHIDEPNRPILGGQYTTSDVGSVFHASPETLAIMEAGLMANGHIDSYAMMSYRFGDADFLIWSGSGAVVPRLGPGLTGYNITDITQTIDSLAWEVSSPSNGLFNGSAQHTIRIYGDAVPEPMSIMLVLAGALFHVRMSSPGNGRFNV